MKKKLSKKRKLLLISSIVIIVFLSSYTAMASFNYVPFPGINSIIKYPNSKNIAKISIKNLFLEFDINSSIIKEIGEMDLSIELELFGIKNNNAQNIFSWYKSEYINQGWDLYKSLIKTGKDWEVYCGVWTKGLMVQASVVAEGSILEKYINYDVISGSALTNAITLKL